MKKRIACSVIAICLTCLSSFNAGAGIEPEPDRTPFVPTEDLREAECLENGTLCRPATDKTSDTQSAANSKAHVQTRIYVRRTPACNRGVFDIGMDFRLEECHIEKKSNGLIAICYGSAARRSRPLEIFIARPPATKDSPAALETEDYAWQHAYVIGRYPRTLTSPEGLGIDPCYSVIVY